MDYKIIILSRNNKVTKKNITNNSRRNFISAGMVALVGTAMPKVVNGEIKSNSNINTKDKSEDIEFNIPVLRTNHTNINKAFRIAIGDLMTNIQPFKDGLLENEDFTILAGLNYEKPWTRDASINVWNFGSVIAPQVAKNTLLAVTKKHNNKNMVGGQYWDAVIWITGAWNYYLFTGDKSFLKFAFDVAENTLEFFENTELDTKSNLFWGPACYGDGVSAYPQYYAEKCNNSSGINYWPDYNKSNGPGVGITMKSLSTNCLYYNAYITTAKMAKELNKPNSQFNDKASKLKHAINKYFWNETKGIYTYLADSDINCNHQEGLGISFAILFGVADDIKIKRILKNTHITKNGISCVWPTYQRYADKNGYGRHSGTVWPHVQGFWADAVASYGKTNMLSHELFNLTDKAVRDNQFAEIYHPETGEIYGGLQESGGPITLWNSTNRQTWSATAYLRMILNGLIGLRFDVDGLSFKPSVPNSLTDISIKNIRYRNMLLNIEIHGNGTSLNKFEINGKTSKPFIPSDLNGTKNIKIQLV